MQQPQAEESIPQHFPWLSWLLVVISIGVHLAMIGDSAYRMGDLHNLYLRYGAAEPVHVWSGEIWRLISAIFVHANLAHLGFNSLVLIQVGKILEPIAGRLNFLLLFLVSGIGAFCASLLSHDQLTLGSSGAVFGLVGALIAYSWFGRENWSEKQLLKTLVLFAIGNVFLGFAFNLMLGPLIDNVAHLSGLVVGLAFGFALAVGEMPKADRLKISALPACAVLFFALTIFSLRPVLLPSYHFSMGQLAITKGDMTQARAHLQRLQEFSGQEGKAHLLLGRILAASGGDARPELLEAMRILDDADTGSSFIKLIDLGLSYIDVNERLFANEKANGIICDMAAQMKEKGSNVVMNNCAWLFLMARDKKIADSKKALTLAQIALEKTEHPQVFLLDTLAQAYAQNGNTSEAKAVLERAIAQSRYAGERAELLKKKAQFNLDRAKDRG